MKKILLINYFYVNYTGSEVLVKQLSEYFYNQKYEVYVGAFFLGSPMIKETNLKINYINLLKVENIKEEFDLVWAHHSTVLNYCIFNLKLKYKKLILSILSPYESMESLPPYYNNIDLVIANSHETKQQLELETNRKINNVFIFPNSVSEEFFLNIEIKRRLNNIAVISNHIPEELRELKKLLEEKNINIDYYGREDIYEEVTPELLKKYDLIITIGKTVQFSFALGVPVYIYDHFGGPGYLNKENYYLEEEKNYSGRSTNEKKEATELLKEIISGYENNLSQLEFFKKLAKERYNFKNNLTKILEKIKKNKEKEIFIKKNIDVIKKDYLFVKRINDNYMKLLKEKINIKEKNKIELKYLINGVEHIFEKEIDLYKEINVRIELNKIKGNLNFIRLDPADNLKCTVFLKSYILNYTDKIFKKTLDLTENITGNYIENINKKFVFETTDPQIFTNINLSETTLNYIEIKYIVY